MSRVYFTTFDDEAELRGSERAWLGLFAEAIGLGMLPKYGNISDVIYPEEARGRLKTQAEIETALRINLSGLRFKIGEEQIEPWVVNLNTALLMGNDIVRLGTFIHAQCEVHGWFKPEDFGWVAKIIYDGLKSGLYREDAGWEEVRLLFLRAETPIVMSYSVTESFPDFGLVVNSDLGPEAHLDREYWWEETLDARQRWDLSMQVLEKKMPSITPEMMSEGFSTREGGTAFTALDVADELKRLREGKR